MTGPRVLVAWTSRREAHQLAENLATDLLGAHPGPLHHVCATCGSIEHGCPSYDAPVAVSFAHAPEVSLVAVSTAGAVGVDVEPRGAADLAWVGTEALAKAHGVGLTVPLPVPVPSHRIVLDVPSHVAVLVVLTEVAPPVEIRQAGSEARAR